MDAAIRFQASLGYKAETPKGRTAAVVLALHLLLLFLVLSLRPPDLPPPPVQGTTLTPIQLTKPEVVAPTDEPVERSALQREVQRLLPEVSHRRSPEGFDGRRTDVAPGPSSPAPGSPAMMPNPIPTPQGTPATGQSAVAGSGGLTNGSGTGSAGTGGAGTGVEGTGDGYGDGYGDGSDGGGGAVIGSARWVTMMHYERLLSFHPREAREARINGRVTLICRVRLNQRVHGCQVEQETPNGLGFGQAAMRASREFRVHPRRIDGREVKDGWVRIPIRFEVPEIVPASN